MYCVWSHPWHDKGWLPTHKWWYCLQIIAPLSDKSLNFSLKNEYILLEDAVVPVHDMWVGTEPCHDASKPGQLWWDDGLSASNSFLLFAFTAISGSTEKVHQPQYILLVPAVTLRAACSGAASSPPAPREEKPWPCWKLLEFVWINICVSMLRIRMFSQVKKGGSEALTESSSHIWKYFRIFGKALLLNLIDVHVWWTPITHCGPHGVMQSATSELQGVPHKDKSQELRVVCTICQQTKLLYTQRQGCKCISALYGSFPKQN